MKTKKLHIIAFIFEMIILCTILSVRIEQLMMPMVVVARKESKLEGIYPKDIIFTDNGKDYIYGVYEGDGWEAGLRIQKLDSNFFDVKGDKVIVKYTGDVKIASFVSKPINDFERVRIVRQESCEDTYFVAYYKDNLVYDKSIVSIENAKYPFMDKYIRKEMCLSDTDKIYSKKDIDSFRAGLLTVTIAALIIVAFIIIGIYDICSAGKRNDSRLWLINIVLMVVLGAIVFKIDLPSSLLPGDNIFNIKYYVNEWMIIQSF